MTYPKDQYRRQAFDIFSESFSWVKHPSEYTENDDVLFAAIEGDRSAILLYLDWRDDDEVHHHTDNLKEITGCDGLSVYISGHFDSGLAKVSGILKRWLVDCEPEENF